MFLTAELKESHSGAGLHVEVNSDGAMDARDLFGDQRVREKAEAVAAVLFGNQAAEETQLAHLCDEVFAKTVCFVIFGRCRRDLFLGKLAREVPDGRQLFRQFKIHASAPCLEDLWR